MMNQKTDYIRPKGGRKITAARLNWHKIADAANLKDAPQHYELIRLSEDLPCAQLIGNTSAALLRRLVLSISKDNISKLPVVYKSNQCLADEMGLSASRVSVMLAELYDAGFITMIDSPNCKRYRITDNGETITAFGIDLRVLISRYKELADLVAEKKRKQKEKRAAVAAFRYALRNFKELANMTGGIFLKTLARVNGLVKVVNSAPIRLLRRLARFLNRVVQREISKQEDFNTSKTHTRHAENTQHIQNTNPNISRKSNQNGNESSPPGGKQRAKEKNAGILQAGSAEINQKPLWIWKKFLPRTRKMFSESAFADGVDYTVIDKIGKICGISPDALSSARQIMDNNSFILSCYLIFEKWSDGKIYKPGGYLRGMTARAQSGDLHLEKSLWGLSAQQME